MSARGIGMGGGAGVHLGGNARLDRDLAPKVRAPRVQSTGQALEVLRRAPGRTLTTLAALLDVRVGTAERYVDRLQRQGLVRCDAYGKWYPADLLPPGVIE